MPIWVLQEAPALLGTVLVLRLLDAQASPAGWEEANTKEITENQHISMTFPY